MVSQTEQLEKKLQETTDQKEIHVLKKLAYSSRLKVNSTSSLYIATDSANASGFDKYVLGEILGVGKTSTVFKAVNTINGTNVAIKEYKKTEDEEDVAYVKREAHIMKKLRVPYVVRMLENFENDSKIWIVMELQPGNLRSYLNVHKSLPEEKAATMVNKSLDQLTLSDKATFESS